MLRTLKRRTFKAPKKPHLFDAIGQQRIGRKVCFLCGRRLTTRNRSDEHVFPKWLQHRFGLWNQQLTLLNGTRIAYRSLKIPCCRECNTRYLAPLERTVERAVARGPRAVQRLSKRKLFFWLTKLLYGILYKEGLLRADPRKPRAGRLVPRPLLESVQTHHYFLQGVRLPMRFVDFFPGSIVVYRLQRPADTRHQFDFRDLPPVFALSLRLGSVGIIAALQDGGTQADGAGEYLRRYHRHPLHPMQFLELTARFFYTATLFTRNPKYITMESTRALEVIQMPLGGFSALPLYGKWDSAAYAQHLSYHTRIPVEQLYRGPDRVMSCLDTPDGEPALLDFQAYPWP